MSDGAAVQLSGMPLRRRDLLRGCVAASPWLLGCAARRSQGASPKPVVARGSDRADHALRREPAAERVIGEQRSRYNHVVVTERGTIRTMYFVVDGARVIESVHDTRDPDGLQLPVFSAMVSALLVHPRPRRLLMIGLGGGQVTNHLFAHVPGIEIDAVDICPAVVELARAHFGIPDDPRYRTHVADGRRFIERSDAARRWDVIILDAYRGATVPLHLRSRQYLEACAARLAEGGVVLANLHSRSRRYPDDRATFAAVFPQIYLFHSATALEASLVASNAPRRLGDAELSANAERLRAEYGLDTAELLARLEPASNPPPAGGRVLEDDFEADAREAGIDRHNESCTPRCAGDSGS